MGRSEDTRGCSPGSASGERFSPPERAPSQPVRSEADGRSQEGRGGARGSQAAGRVRAPRMGERRGREETRWPVARWAGDHRGRSAGPAVTGGIRTHGRASGRRAERAPGGHEGRAGARTDQPDAPPAACGAGGPVSSAGVHAAGGAGTGGSRGGRRAHAGAWPCTRGGRRAAPRGIRRCGGRPGAGARRAAGPARTRAAGRRRRGQRPLAHGHTLRGPTRERKGVPRPQRLDRDSATWRRRRAPTVCMTSPARVRSRVRWKLSRTVVPQRRGKRFPRLL